MTTRLRSQLTLGGVRMPPIDRLESARSIDEFADLVQGDLWKAYLAALARRPEPGDEVERLRRAVADAKRRLSPEHACPELQALKEQVYAGAADPEALRPLLGRLSQLRAAPPLRQHDRLFAHAQTTLG